MLPAGCIRSAFDRWQKRAAHTHDGESLLPLVLDSIGNRMGNILARTAASAAKGSAQGDRTGGDGYQG